MAFYARLLQTHPIATKTLTSATLFGLGDLMSQTQFEKKKEVDQARLARMVAWGGMFAPRECRRSERDDRCSTPRALARARALAAPTDARNPLLPSPQSRTCGTARSTR